MQTKLFLLGVIMLIPAFNSAIAGTLQGSTSGIFVNPGPASGSFWWSGVGTDTFSWGEAFPDQSWMKFTGTSFDTDTETLFSLGNLYYHNGTIVSGTEADNVTLKLTLAFTAPPSQPSQFFQYNFTLVNTVNTGDPVASADYVYLPSPVPAELFTIGGTTYTLQMGFGKVDAGGFSTISQFHVFEGDNATADLIGIVTTKTTPIIPEPWEYGLLSGLGLVGFGLWRRAAA